LSSQASIEHVCVCICTYKRPQFLKRSLVEIDRQVTDPTFTHSIIVVDNDENQSACQVVSDFSVLSDVDIEYLVEPRQSIALARNKAIEHARGDYIVFIDDDELPIRNWLYTLVTACREYKVDGVLGPVKPLFEVRPPEWVIKGRFHERPSYDTGLAIDWQKGRTGNTLLTRRVFDELGSAFDPAYVVGEDQDFFRRMIDKGFAFIWCNEATAYEIVPPSRWKRTFLLKRALQRGKVRINHPSHDAQDTIKSLFAIAIYTMILPFSPLLGHHRFMDYSIRLFDHLGKILACIGANPIKDKYVTS